jgi:hypothetical protein
MSKIVVDAKQSSLRIDFKELKSSRDLFYILAYRDLRVRYAQTFLGFVWALLQPLATLLIFVLVFGMAVKVDTGIIPYPEGSQGDVLASIHVERRGDSSDPPGVLRVVAFVSRCGDRDCDVGTLLEFEDLGEYQVGGQIRLLIQWDEANNQFIFQRDNEPQFIYTYPGMFNVGPANLPRKRLGISPRVTNCTVGPGEPRPVAFVETLIDKVFVNESAVP